ncbi:MAG: hypothetical protein ACI9MC_004170, partial [Kiritimatiellia bacterium]
MVRLLPLIALLGIAATAHAADEDDADLGAALAPVDQVTGFADTSAARPCNPRVTRCTTTRTNTRTTVRSSQPTRPAPVQPRAVQRSNYRAPARAPARASHPPARPAHPPARQHTQTRPAPHQRPAAHHYSRGSHQSGGVIVHRGYGAQRHVAPPPRVVRTYNYRPYHGIFVYGPRPVYHQHYRTQSAPAQVQKSHLPNRKIDRTGSVAIGVRSGSYLTGYDSGDAYGDFGLGLVARYRPVEALGIEAVVVHHDEYWNESSERGQTLSQGSLMLFANPWGKIQPYVLGGLTVNKRNIDDAFNGTDGPQLLQTQDTLWGPHAGAGVELAFGKRAALDLELR